MAFDLSSLVWLLVGVLLGLAISYATGSIWSGERQRSRRRGRYRWSQSTADPPDFGSVGWKRPGRLWTGARRPDNFDALDIGSYAGPPPQQRADAPSAAPHSIPRPTISPVPYVPAVNDQSLALRLYASDVDEFRRRFRPQVVEPDRTRIDLDADDIVVREQGDGPYWLITVAEDVGLIFPRPNRAFGRGMMQYAAAPILFEIRGFREGFRYRRTIVHAPVRMIAEGEGWRRHTKGILEVLDEEPDE